MVWPARTDGGGENFVDGERERGSLVPRPRGRGKAAWYPLHAHARNHPKSW